MADRLPPAFGESPEAFGHLDPLHAWPPLTAQGDALASPSVDDLAPHLADLLPRGAAWRTPDGAAFDWTSRMGGMMRGFAGALALIYARLFALTGESTASTLSESLVDWEDEFGLPDPCLGLDPSREVRLRSLLAKVRSTGTITPADFIDLAAALGLSIAIREPLPWRAGASRCGAVGERVAGGEAVEFIWIVRPAQSEILPFRAGKARAGTTPLGEIIRNERLECLFNAVKPAWTKVIFDYSGA